MVGNLIAHEALFFWLTIISVCTFAGSLIVVPWLIVHLPTDYFNYASRRSVKTATGRPILRIIALITKNIMGLILFLAGIIMLFIPGQGLLTIGIGILLLDFPGKYGVERWIITRGPILKSINRIRKRANRPPMDL